MAYTAQANPAEQLSRSSSFSFARRRLETENTGRRPSHLLSSVVVVRSDANPEFAKHARPAFWIETSKALHALHIEPHMASYPAEKLRAFIDHRGRASGDPRSKPGGTCDPESDGG